MKKILELLLLLQMLCLAAPETAKSAPQYSHGCINITLVRCGDLLYVPVSVNNNTVGNFLLDTGSSITTLRQDIVNRLHLQIKGRKKIDLQIGSANEDFCDVNNLALGPFPIGKCIVFIDDEASLSLPNGELISGIIGMDVLSRQPFTIDFRNAILTIWSSSGFPHSKDGSEFPLQVTGDTPRIQVSIENHKGWFEFDTGHPGLLISRSFALENAELVADRAQIRRSVPWASPADRYEVRWHSIEFLGRNIRDNDGEYQAVAGLEHIAGLIGGGFFRESELTIDMKARCAWIHWLDPEPLDKLLERFKSLDEQRLTGVSPIVWAIRIRHPDAVKALLDQGVNPNLCDLEGATPIMEAAGRGNNECITELIHHGAEVNAISMHNGVTALAAAAAQGHLGTVKLLIDAGADPNRGILEGRTPLFLAAEGGYDDVVSFLLDRQAEVDTGLSTGETPLLSACYNGNVKCVSLLLEHKANPNAAGPRGNCLTYASDYGSVDSLKMLVDAGADLNRPAPNGITPLAAAAAQSRHGSECVEFLLRAGADPNLKCRNGKRPLDYAIESGSPATIQMLLPTPTTQGSKSTSP